LPPRFISVYALEGGGEKEGEGKVGDIIFYQNTILIIITLVPICLKRRNCFKNPKIW